MGESLNDRPGHTKIKRPCYQHQHNFTSNNILDWSILMSNEQNPEVCKWEIGIIGGRIQFSNYFIDYIPAWKRKKCHETLSIVQSCCFDICDICLAFKLFGIYYISIVDSSKTNIELPLFSAQSADFLSKNTPLMIHIRSVSRITENLKCLNLHSISLSLLNGKTY